MNIFDINNTLTTIIGYKLSYVEFIGTLFGLLSVWLAAKEHIGTWITGIVCVVFSFALFYQSHLYSDMFLQVYFLGTNIFGWITWLNQKQEDKPIRTLSVQSKIIVIVILILGTSLMGYFISHLHEYFPQYFPQPAAFAYPDSLVAVCSIVAFMLLAKRILENWILWLIVNILCVIIYAKKELYFYSLQYLIFVGLAILGYVLWIKSYKASKSKVI